MSVKLSTWADRTVFSYSGSVKTGTEIVFGENNNKKVISKNQYDQLLNHFSGKTIKIGTSFNNPPEDSVGEWLLENVFRTAVASYVGPILIHEGYAKKISPDEIMIF